jgi:hypothetical protein
MNFTIITATGDRPEAFDLCERYVARQTLQPAQWIVLDDGLLPAVCTCDQEVFHDPAWRGKYSLARKIRFVLEHQPGLIRGDAIAFIEDDDWYAPDTLAQFAALFAATGADLIGEGRSLYYNVADRFWFEHPNMQHASLCATAARGPAIRAILDQVLRSDDPFVDMHVWSLARVRKHIRDPLQQPEGRRFVIGIKGVPGRAGYGGGRERIDRAASDPHLEKLAELTSAADAARYAPFARTATHAAVPA